MNKEEIGITASKKDDFSEWYTQVVLKAELADYAPVKGLIVLRPSGYSIWESLKVSLDKKLALQGVSNGFLPILIPESLLGKEKKHFAGFDPEVFWVTHSGKDELGDRLALRPTSETLAYTMYAKWIKSWRDLPLRINFWNTALRAEIKATKPFLRTSEFLWQEGHTVHADSDEAKNETKAIMNIYKETVENELAIPVITGKKSEKEQFVGAVYTITMESMMPDGRALQMGTSHFLGQNFSKPFEVKYADKNNVEKFTWQTSWGVSWRLLGAMIMVHGDDHGLVLPPKVAPIQVVIIPIYYSKEDEKDVCSKAEQIRMEISKMGMRTHMDKREGMTPGFKYHDWEMRGIPLRKLGPRDLKENVYLQRGTSGIMAIVYTEKIHCFFTFFTCKSMAVRFHCFFVYIHDCFSFVFGLINLHELYVLLAIKIQRAQKRFSCLYLRAQWYSKNLEAVNLASSLSIWHTCIS